MPLTSRILPYNSSWPDQFEAERQRLVKVFDKVLEGIHHIGSTAIPGISAKPEIDILVVIRDINVISDFHHDMESLGYRVRGDVFADHHYFTRDANGRRTHKVHVCPPNHATVCEQLQFRDFLRAHSDVRDSYQALKLKLEHQNKTGISEYLDGKEPFIREVLARVNVR